MTSTVAPSLDQLLESNEPAWLWDSARARIAWANNAGTAWFGANSLFDIIDMVFDRHDASIAAIAKLGARLPRGKSEAISFSLGDPAQSDDPRAFQQRLGLQCDCYVHALADGRSGLLVCAQKPAEAPTALPAAMQAMALGAFPMALSVVRGSGENLFSNDAMNELLGGRRHAGKIDLSFADHLIEASFNTGTASQTVQTTTPLGERDLRVIVRLLEHGDRHDSRLADASFMVVIEDVTERRALEQTLLSGLDDAILPRSKSSPNSSPRQMADTLSHLKREIETQTRLAEAQIEQEPETPIEDKAPTPAIEPTESRVVGDRAKAEDRVPAIVQDTLNNLPQPLVLLSHEGEILFANDVTVQLLGAQHWRELGEMTTLGDALSILEGEDGEISLFTLQDEPLNLEVMIASFPWKDGAVYQATLSPSDDGERADNRRKENHGASDDVKKNTEITPDEDGDTNSNNPNPRAAKNIALSASDSSSDNVVSFRRENDQDINDQTGAPSKSTRNPNDEDLRAILDTATDGIITLDRKGKICSFSAGAEALFGYDAHDVFGMAFKKLMARPDRKIITQYIAALSGDGLASVFNDGREVEAQVKQGGEISLFVTIGKMANARLDMGRTVVGRSALGHDGDGTAAFCVVVRDITQRKKTEADLRQAKEKAEKSSERKSNFLANISHELRTPLNAIMGFSEVMLSERFGEIENKKYLGYANDIHASGAHLLSLINDLLDLSKVEAGKLELNFTGVNLLNEVDEAIHTLQDQADQKRVLLSKALKGGLPNVVADLRSIKQVLLNLLSNAIKFTESGGQVTVAVKLTDSGEMILSIKDNGRGMSRSQLKRALEPFEQIEPASSGGQTGTGLGLPLTKALVEANRAKFSIISAPKKGTLVEVVFPTTRVLAE